MMIAGTTADYKLWCCLGLPRDKGAINKQTAYTGSATNNKEQGEV
jgi:hypothetical protein